MAKRKKSGEGPGNAGLILLVAVVALFVSLRFRVSFWLAVALVVGVPVLLVYGGAFAWALIKSGRDSSQKLPTKTNAKAIVVDTPQALEKFRASHMLRESTIIKVKGVTFCNDDGQSRQPIVAQCHRGDPVEIRFEWYKDAPAYAVWTDHGQIGYLPADEARRIYNAYGDDVIFCGTVDAILGGCDGLNYGCNIRLEIYT